MAPGRASAYHPGMAQILSIDARVSGPIEPEHLWYGRCLDWPCEPMVRHVRSAHSIERILRRPRLSPTLIGRMLLGAAGGRAPPLPPGEGWGEGERAIRLMASDRSWRGRAIAGGPPSPSGRRGRDRAFGRRPFFRKAMAPDEGDRAIRLTASHPRHSRQTGGLTGNSATGPRPLDSGSAASRPSRMTSMTG